MPSYDECKKAMIKAGCKITVQDINKDPEFFKKCTHYSPYMRKRLTLLRLRGMIKNSYVRLLDVDQNEREICRYNLTDNYAGMTAMIFGEVYRHDGEWKFNAMGQGTGDANLDGVTDLTDLTELSLYLLGDKSFDEYEIMQVDVNNDGKVNIADLPTLKMMITKGI